MFHRAKIWYEGHRKTFNENVGLIVGVLAALFAGWSGYEAHLARNDAAKIAESNLKEQSRGVDAQIMAMQLDERPFIRVFVNNDAADADTQKTASARIAFEVFGKSPALDVQISTVRGSGPENTGMRLQQVGRFDSSVPHYRFEEDTKNAQPDKYERWGLLYPGAKQSTGTWVFDRSEGFLIEGYVTYTDLFKATHKTEFCYALSGGAAGSLLWHAGSSTAHNNLLFPCQDFTPQIL